MKCSCCKKQTHIPLKCNHCEKMFCLEHRLPEIHKCPSAKFEKVELIKLVPEKLVKV